MDEVRRVQVQQVRAAVAPDRCPSTASGVAVAFSGGPDSTALLHALAQAQYKIPLRALHVCHNMQPQARQWAQHCQQVCNRLGVAFACLDVQVNTRASGTEAGARDARYRALAEALQADEVLALAQHADDQAETFLIQALRGAGVAGLAAMPATKALAAGCLWRPLLTLQRQTLVGYAEAHELPAVDDPSNRDTNLDRGYIRTQLQPVLAARWPQASRALGRSAHWCAEAAALVDEVAADDLARVIDDRRCIMVRALQTLSLFRQGGALRRWLAIGGFDTPDHRHIAHIQQMMMAAERTGPVVRWRGTEVRLFDGRLHAMRPLAEPPATAWQCDWSLAAELPLPQGCGRLIAQCDDVPSRGLTVRFRRGGERFVDARRGGHHRLLKKFLQEARVPPWERARLPLVYDHGRLVAIADYWLAADLARNLGLSSLNLVWLRQDA